MSKKLPVNGEFNSDLLVALFIFLKGRAGPSTYLLPFHQHISYRLLLCT
ncbi:hypothetical protein [Desulfonauticus submarinus]